MQTSGWLQLALYIVALAAITKPMGLYLTRVLDAQGRTQFDPVLKPLEQLTYASHGARRAGAKLAAIYGGHAVVQPGQLPVHLCHFAAAKPSALEPAGTRRALAGPGVQHRRQFTNTNWQSYAGESTMSYFSQMVALVIHNFTSAATGIAIASALVRSWPGIHAIARQFLEFMNFVRVTYYLLLPLSVVLAVFLVSQGIIQNFKPYTQATLVEPMHVSVAKVDAKGNPVRDKDGKPVMEDQTVTRQSIVQGPVASQIAIKMLGTNGGGYHQRQRMNIRY